MSRRPRGLTVGLLLLAVAVLPACEEYLDEMESDLRITLLGFHVAPDSLDLTHDPGVVALSAQVEANAILEAATFRLSGPFAEPGQGEPMGEPVNLGCTLADPSEEGDGRTRWDCDLDLGAQNREGFYRVESVAFQLADRPEFAFTGGELQDAGYPVVVQVDRDRVAAIVVEEGDGQEARVVDRLPESLQARVLYESGRPVPDAEVGWNVLRGGGEVVPGSARTDADGRVRADWTMGPQSGPQEVWAQVVNVESVAVPFGATALPGPLAAAAPVGGMDQEGPVGSVLPLPLQIRTADAFDNPVPGVPVVWEPEGEASGSLSPPSNVTDEEGLASAHWMLGPGTGQQGARATARDGGEPVPVGFRATAGSGPPEAFTRVDGDQQEGVVGEPLEVPLEVRLYDAFDNPVPNQPVVFRAPQGQGTLNPSGPVTGADGVARTIWTLGPTAGPQTVVAEALDGALTLGFQAEASPGPPALLELVDPDSTPTGIVAETLPDPVRVRVTDGFGNPTPGGAVVFTAHPLSPPVPGEAVPGQFDPERVEADEEGVAEAHWTLGGTAGEQTAEAALPETDEAVSFIALGAAAAAEALELVAGDGQVAVIETPVPDSLMVLARDSFGNPVPGAEISWTILSGDGAATPTSITDSTGVARAEWTLGPEESEQEVEARLEGTGQAVTFTATGLPVPGEPAAVTLGPEGLQLERIGTPATLQREVRDGEGNLIPGASLAWLSSDPSVVSVDGGGVVRAENTGTAIITGRIGDVEGTLEVTVALSRQVQLIELNEGPVAPSNPYALEDRIALKVLVQAGDGPAIGGLRVERLLDPAGTERYGRLDAPVQSGGWAVLGLTLAAAPSGEYDARILSWAEGDESSTEVWQTFRVAVTQSDVIDPTGSFLEPVQNAEVPEEGFDARFRIEDESGIFRWRLSRDGIELASERLALGGELSLERTIAVPPLDPGVHVLTLRAWDVALNESEIELTVEVPQDADPRYVAVATDDFGIERFVWSDDGISWAGVYDPGEVHGDTPLPGYGGNVRELVHNGDHWLAVGNHTSGGASIHRSLDGVEWTAASSVPGGGPTRQVVWAGTEWLGLNNVETLRSPDGDVWSVVGASGGSSIASDGNRILRVRGMAQVEYSFDGVDWETLPLDFAYDRVAWNGQAWVMAGLDGRLAVSRDGYLWEEGVSPLSGSITPYWVPSALAWTGERWVGPGRDVDGEWLYSDEADASEWHASSSPSSGSLTSVAADPEQVLVTTLGPTILMGDGSHLSPLTLDRTLTAVGARDAPLSPVAPAFSIVAPEAGSSVTQGMPVFFQTSLGDGFVVGTLEWESDRDGILGQGPMLSTNALTLGTHRIVVRWETPAGPGDEPAMVVAASILLDVMPPALPGGWVAAGTSTGTDAILAGSDDAIQWTVLPLDNPSGPARAVAYSGTSWAVVGTSGDAWYSEDLAIWEKVDRPDGETMHDVVWAGDRWVAVGDDGTAAVSMDGRVWTGHEVTPQSQSMTGVAWNGGLLVAVGDWGSIFTSSDGIEWTLRHEGFNSLYGVGWNGQQWAAIGGWGLVSQTGMEWEGASAFWDFPLYKALAWTGDEWLGVGDFSAFGRGAGDFSTWDESMPWSGHLSGVAVDPDMEVVVREDGSVLRRALPGGSWSDLEPIPGVSDIRSLMTPNAPPVRWAPTVTILEPTGGALVAGLPLTLRGEAVDADNQPITGASLVWRSDLEGVLGTGEEIQVTYLHPGRDHVILLTATDAQGASGGESVTITTDDYAIPWMERWMLGGSGDSGSPVMATSRNGTNWIDLDFPIQGFVNQVTSDGSRWVATVDGVGGGFGRGAAYSDDGVRWSAIAGVSRPMGVIHTPEGWFLGEAATGEVKHSTDGITWSVRGQPLAGVNDLAYMAGTLVAVGASGDGFIAYSTDGGFNWTNAGITTGGSLFAVDSDGSRWVAAGRPSLNGTTLVSRYFTSEDLDTWEMWEMPVGGSGFPVSVKWSGREWMMGTQNGMRLFRSENGLDWEQVYTTTNGYAAHSFGYDGDRWMAAAWELSWTGDVHTWTLHESVNGGQSWTARNTPMNRGATAVGWSEPLPVNGRPTAEIVFPDSEGQTLSRASDSVVGAGIDPDGDPLTLNWESDVSGSVGTGLILPVSSLQVGSHQLTLIVEDPSGARDEVTIGIIVVD